VAESNPHPDKEIQKRRSTRIVQAVPLTVTGVDALGRPFQERTSTLIINCHGTRYQSKHYVLKNMWVTLEVPHNEPGQPPRTVRGRVTWIQRPRTVRELFQIGVELEVSGNVWGIAFPPSDWFPFTEAGTTPKLQIPAPPTIPEPVAEAPTAPEAAAPSRVEEWAQHRARPTPVSEPEDNLRVLPLPAGEESSQQLQRQFARLLAEAKVQMQSAARESAAQAVAAETTPLLSALQTQLNDAAQKSVAAAVTAHMEKSQQETLQHMEKEREAGMAAMLDRLAGELDRRLSEARQQIDSQLAEVERTRQAQFEQQIQNQLNAAMKKLESLTGSVGANRDEVLAVMDQLRKSSALAAEEEIRRWQEQMDRRTADAQARLAQMDQAARKLGEQIAAATTIGEVGWRGLLEADLAAASTRLQEQMEVSIAETSRRANEQLARESEISARQIEEQLRQRIDTLYSANSQITSEAESALGNWRAAIKQETVNAEAVVARLQESVSQLDSRRYAEAESALGVWRAAISQETAKGEAALARFQESAAQMDAKRSEFSAQVQAASDELTQRSAAMLEMQTSEMNRRAESAVEGIAQRLQPMLESAGQDTIEKLAKDLEQRLAPQITGVTETLGKLAFDRDLAEKAVSDHQHRVWQVSDRSLQETAARGKEILAQVEKDFNESARTASGRWLAEIETRATETSHSTFESLFKSADWYEKKIQTQMQTTLEKGLDQAASRLREKAAEMSGLFASELDHYSRSYVEHARGQMQENAREAAEHGSKQMAEAGDTAAAKFTERAAQLGNEQFDLYASKTRMAFDQNAAYMEAHTTQVRAKLESDARGFAAEFQRVLSQHAQQTLALGKQELGIQIDQAKDALLMESQGFERHFQASLTSLGTSAMDEHKQRLENASNSWLLTTVTKLNQQSGTLIDELADTTEKRLKAVCAGVFSEMGESLRQRLAGLTAAFGPPTSTPMSPAPPVNPSDDKK